jgi:hypothetical protein
MPELRGFCAPSGATRSPFVACDRTINLYLEESPNDRGRMALYSMPGLRPVAVLPSVPVRGLYTTSTGRTFAVTSTTLFEVFAGWTFLSRGTLPTGTTPVPVVDNGLHLFLSVDGLGRALDLTSNVLSTVAPPGLAFGRVFYLDGYLVSHDPGTRRFYYSDLFDALTWDALNFYEAEGRPDPITTPFVDHRELWIYGSQSTEVWYSTGDSLNPFARMSGVFLEQGSGAPFSVAALDNTIFWLGGSTRGESPVWMANGYQPVRVSTHALESAMSGMPTVADAVGFTARHGGHAFYGLDFPSGGETWLYDTSTQAWTELAHLQPGGTLTNYPSHHHCMAFGFHLWGDRTTGDLYVWDPAYHRYGTKERLWERTAPHLRSEGQRLTYHCFELLMQAGVGLDGTVATGEDPRVRLQWSDDGAQIWSMEHWRSAGRIGHPAERVRWHRLGQAYRQRAFRVGGTDPVQIAIYGASVEAS